MIVAVVIIINIDIDIIIIIARIMLKVSMSNYQLLNKLSAELKIHIVFLLLLQSQYYDLLKNKFFNVFSSFACLRCYSPKIEKKCDNYKTELQNRVKLLINNDKKRNINDLKTQALAQASMKRT